MAIGAVSVLVSGLRTAEGPAFDREGNLFFVDWERSAVMRRTPDGEVSVWIDTGGIPAGLAFDREGNLYVADEGDGIHGILRVGPGREVTTLVDAYEGAPLNGANDLAFAPDGTLYFSDPWRSSLERPIGGFYRLFPGADGRLERIDTGLAFPNGVAIDAAGTAVYLAETGRRRILRYPIGADGAMGPREHWADLAGWPGAGGPDGMAFDAGGNLYVADYGGARVAIFARDGRQTGEIAVPGAKVTNCAFAPDGRGLVVTEVATGSVYLVDVVVGGQGLYGCEGEGLLG